MIKIIALLSINPEVLSYFSSLICFVQKYFLFFYVFVLSDHMIKNGNKTLFMS